MNSTNGAPRWRTTWNKAANAAAIRWIAGAPSVCARSGGVLVAQSTGANPGASRTSVPALPPSAARS